MINFNGMYTDFYQLAMAQSYFLRGQQDDIAVFDYFYRSQPFGGGYAIFAGLENFIDALLNLSFVDEDILFLKEQGLDNRFLDYLKNFKFSGTILSTLEGDVVFPYRPILTIKANIIEAQLIETLLLNILNFQTLIATKARRIRTAAGKDAALLDFGLRRAQGAGSYHASRAAYIGGFDATSHIKAGQDHQIKVSGTMAHSFVQSYEREIDAFRDFVLSWPEQAVLLVDTYDTLNSGLPHAIQVAKEMRSQGQALKGIRLDSGDLEFLSRQARNMLDDAGFPNVQIAASNQLDEFLIADLKANKAPIDIFGVGTNLVTGQPEGALDGVYKLVSFNDIPRIKVSDNLAKVTLPGEKQIYRLKNEDDFFSGYDVVSSIEEQSFGRFYKAFDMNEMVNIHYDKLEPVLYPIVKNGQRQRPQLKSSVIKEFSQERFACLPEKYKTLVNPAEYLTLMSESMFQLKQQLLHKHRFEEQSR